MENIQVIWGFTFLGWFLLDFVLVQTSHAFLRYHWCTNWCKSSVAVAISVIKQNLMSIHNEPDYVYSVPGETNPLRMGDASNRLNLVLFSSAQIIAHFLKLGVTQSRAMNLIAKFGSPFPQYRLVVREQMFYHLKNGLLSFFYKKSVIMLVFVYLPPRLGALIMQELVIIFWCGVAYLVFAVLTNPMLWHYILLILALLCLLWVFSQDALIAYLKWIENRDDDSSDTDSDIIIQDRIVPPISDLPAPDEPISPAEPNEQTRNNAPEAADVSFNEEESEVESAMSSAEDISIDHASASSLPRPPSTTTPLSATARASTDTKPKRSSTPSVPPTGVARKPAPSTIKQAKATGKERKPKRSGESSFHM
jgi:hypothetical protein